MLRIFQVDAFTDRLFGGNPAAVCPLMAWPEDALLQAVAAENNLSARQLSRRGGALECRLDGKRVILTGSAVDFMHGELAIEAGAPAALRA